MRRPDARKTAVIFMSLVASRWSRSRSHMEKDIQKTRYIEYAVLGASCFWLPDIILQSLLKDSDHRVWFLAALPSLAWLLAYIVKRRSLTAAQSRTILALFMLLGVWIAGPISVSAELHISDHPYYPFPDGIVWSKLATMVAVFPLTTFALSMYSGSIGAISIVTCCFIFIAMWE